ncbi:MAG: CBS domain-containing protein [Gammaproteobacteria bacterium]
MSGKLRVSVRQVMKTHFDEVDGLATIRDALNTMQHVETKMLIVRKRDDHDEIGVLLLSDIAKEVIAKDRSPDRVNVYEIMSKPVISVEPDMDIRYCARLFERFGLSRAPVVENGKLVGTVSYTDMVLKGLCQAHELCDR